MTDVNTKIDEWLRWDKNNDTRAEIQALKETENVDKLKELLFNRLQFGTAGLRGKMGAGYANMNDLVVIQTSQGLCKYLSQVFKEELKQRGVVVGYDGRHNSKRFAELTANIFTSAQIPVYLFSYVCPTPYVAFAVRHFKCSCGVMITASHNPKEDNGYKVYWNNGAQIVSPHDKNIQENILDNLEPWSNSWNLEHLKQNSLLKDPLPEILAAYSAVIARDTTFPDTNRASHLIFTYTAMHGVGYPYMRKAFEAAQLLPFVVVTKQRDPDPEFPTVDVPNPEEGKSALDLSIEAANQHGSRVILANDPDADRLAVAEKKISGEWRIFTGNEIGALLGWWSLYCHKKKYPQTTLDNVYMLSSTVSSKILQSMASIEGFNFVETLTGFKWMGNEACKLTDEGKTVIFAFEEAIGFMWGTAVLDKDGISAGVRVASLAAHLYIENTTLQEKLSDIYRKYGQHLSLNSYYICHEPPVVKSMFNNLRTYKGSEATYPDSILNGKYTITGVRDLTTGYDSNQPDKKAVLPTSSSTQMVTFTFSNGLVATLRTSGTEPKIKYYTELCAPPTQQNKCRLQSTLHEMVNAIVSEFLQPEKNGLKSKSS